MSDELKAGDRVWWHRMRLSESMLTLTQHTGTMLETVDHIVRRKDWPVMVMADENDGHCLRCAIRPSKLHRLPASAAAPAPSFAGLVDDYADVMLRFAGAIESGAVEA